MASTTHSDAAVAAPPSATFIEPPPLSVKTRLCFISDTHSAIPAPSAKTQLAYREPLPSADVLFHAGDMTQWGTLEELEVIADMLKAAPAEFKIVIAGNHDYSLDYEYYSGYQHRRHNRREGTDKARELLCGEEAVSAGIRYMEEDTQTFKLKNGARLTVFGSPYHPQHCQGAFQYRHDVDRWNTSQLDAKFQAPRPIPDFPVVDVLITHGPPYGIHDYSVRGEVHAGCPHLFRAIRRARPRIAAFGHIHEGYGCSRMDWKKSGMSEFRVDRRKTLRDRCVYVDISEGATAPLKFGDETLFVNASVMNTNYRPTNAPWIVDLDLPRYDTSEEAD